MLKQGTVFRKRYEHRPVTIEQIEIIEREIELKLNAKKVESQLRPKKPKAFEDMYGPKWVEFCNVWGKFPLEIRKFNICFATGKMTNRAESVCVDLVVRNQGHYGEPEEKEINLSGYNISESDFQKFCKICETGLGITPAPPSGFDLPHERLMERVGAAISDPGLLKVINGPLSHKDYDGAIRSATVEVEDQLKQKCVLNGRLMAAKQTGVDLAETAYHDVNGCLTPPWPIATSALNGAHLMFRGFFMYLRNAWGHSQSVMGNDPTAVFDCLATCQFLLIVIAHSTKR